MKTVKIFIASSIELEKERETMALLANSLNTVLEKQGIHVIAVEWENIDASMGIPHKQEDYNERLRECDICIVLYWTKFGMYTKMELDTALEQMKVGNNPQKIYVYFKEGSEPTAELKEFRDSFPTKYGHFYTSFGNLDTLKAHFLLQFMEYQSQILKHTNTIEVKNGKVIVDGKEYVNLKNVPFAGNNEEYNLLQKNISDIRELLKYLPVDNPIYNKRAEELQEMEDKLSKMESSLWDTALLITRLSTTKCSERLQRAMELFSNGDNKGAQAVLNEEEIEKDVQHNLNLIKLGEEGRKGILTNIEEYRLKIKTLENEMYEGWDDKVYKIYNKIFDISEGNIPILKYAYILWDYVDFLIKQNAYHLVGDLYEVITEILREHSDSETQKAQLAYVLTDMASFYSEIGRFEDVEAFIDESNKIYRQLICENSQKYCEEFATRLCNQAKIHIELDDIEKGICELNEALDYIKQIESDDLYDKSLYAMVMDNLGVAYAKIGNKEKAIDCHKKSLEIRRNLVKEDKDTYLPDLIIGLNNSALYLKDDEASILLKESLESLNYLAQKNPNRYLPDIALALMNLGLCHGRMHNYDLAYKEVEEAIDIRRYLAKQQPNVYTEELAWSLDAILSLRWDNNEYDKALKESYEAVKIYKELEKQHNSYYKKEISRSLNNLAWTYYLKGESQKGLKYAEESVSIQKKCSNLDTLARIYQELNYIEKAIKTFTFCLELAIEGNKPFEFIEEIKKRITTLQQ